MCSLNFHHQPKIHQFPIHNFGLFPKWGNPFFEACRFMNLIRPKSSGEDPKATEGLVSNIPHPWVNKTKQHLREIMRTSDSISNCGVTTKTKSILMLMIAFITITSSLVPLIESVCAQIHFIFETSVVMLTSSSFLFCERKNTLKENLNKKAVSPDFYL